MRETNGGGKERGEKDIIFYLRKKGENPCAHLLSLSLFRAVPTIFLLLLSGLFVASYLCVIASLGKASVSGGRYCHKLHGSSIDAVSSQYDQTW